MSFWARSVLGFAACFGFAGCQSERYADRAPEVVDMPSAFDHAQDGQLDEEWFHFFNDPQLEGLVDEALEENFDIRIAWRRLQEAQAQVDQADAQLWPSVSTSLEASRQRISGSGVGLGAGRPTSGGETAGGGTNGSAAAGAGEPQSITLLTASLAASYEVDLWGRLSDRADAASLEAQATRQDLQAIAMTTAVQITSTWLNLIASRERKQVIVDQIAAAGESLRLAKLNLGQGQGSALNLVEQEQQIENLRGLLVQERARYELAENQLAVLIGRPPQGFGLVPPAGLPVLEAPPPTGVPGQLLARRPDLQAAMLRLRAGDKRLAATVADQLPRITLSPSVYFQGTELGNLFDQLLWTLSGGLSDTLFAGGRQGAEVDAQRARSARLLEEYGQSVLQALQDVADALENEAAQRAYIASLSKQASQADDAVALSVASYSRGEVDYQRVLTALDSSQALQRQLVTAHRDLLGYRVQLYRALGGSWPESLTPEPPMDFVKDHEETKP